MSKSSIDRVVVISDDCVRSGGAASIMLSSLEQLRARGVPTTLITGDKGENPELQKMGVEVVALAGQHILDGSRISAAARGLYDYRTAAAIADWISKRDTPNTVYHLHNWHKVLSPSVFAPLRKVAPRLVMSAHDYFLTCPNGGQYNFRSGMPCNLAPLGAACLATSCDKRNYAHKLWRVARTAVRHAAFDMHSTPATVVVVHDGMIPLVENGGVNRAAIHVLRNPVTPWTATRVRAEQNRQFLFVGRLEVDKGVVLLARAARRAGAPMRIIGEGPLSDTLKAEFPELELTGWKSRPEIADLCREARAVIMPSRWRETFGLVALEAATSGIPVVASRAALITEDLARLQIAVPFEADDEQALATALQQLMADDALVAAMSERAFRDASQLAPSPEAWGESLLALYGQKIADARRPLQHADAVDEHPRLTLSPDLKR